MARCTGTTGLEVHVKIGSDERALGDVDPNWINQEINQRRRDGESVCVIVRIQTDRLDMVLRTPTCGPTGGGGRQATAEERRVFDLWDKRGLNQSTFNGGNLVAFLEQLDSFL